MLMGLLAKFETVREAHTPEEREAVYRLRYDVYVGELNKEVLKNVDHTKKQICDPEDHRADSILLYTGTPQNMTGTVRIDIWRGGDRSDAVRENFSLDLMPALESENICEVGRLVVGKSSRGLFIFPALAREMYRQTVIENDIRYGFAYCAPGLVRAYRQMGMRLYSGRLIYIQDGIRVPLLNVLSDVDFLRQVGSPFADLARHKFSKSILSDLARVRHVLADQSFDEVDQEQLIQSWQNEVSEVPGNQGNFLASLGQDVMGFLGTKGIILDVAAGQKMTRQDLVEEEMFVVLEGCFEVIKNKRRVAVLGKGDIFGEMAMLLYSKQRTATVVSLAPSRILILRRKFISELEKKEPKIACQILMALSQTLAWRLAQSNG